MSGQLSWHNRIAAGFAGARPTLPNVAAKRGLRVRVARMLRRWANRIDPPKYGSPTLVNRSKYAGQTASIGVAGLLETFGDGTARGGGS